jgi:hypothetical protein
MPESGRIIPARKNFSLFDKTSPDAAFLALYKALRLCYLLDTAYPIGLREEGRGSYLYPTTLSLRSGLRTAPFIFHIGGRFFETP